LPIEDDSQADITEIFKKAVPFLIKGIANDEAVLVNCHAGVSRNIFIVSLYLHLLSAPT
jgi:protein-tyrosine phosphatase